LIFSIIQLHYTYFSIYCLLTIFYFKFLFVYEIILISLFILSCRYRGKLTTIVFTETKLRELTITLFRDPY